MDSLQKSFLKEFKKFEIKPNEMLLENSLLPFFDSLMNEERNNLPVKLIDLQSEGYISIEEKYGVRMYFLTQKGADFLKSESIGR